MKESWNAQHPDLKAPFTFDQMWLSAILIELETCNGGIRELVRILREGPKGETKT